jgi:uncharacterized protein (TIGR02466 family)
MEENTTYSLFGDLLYCGFVDNHKEIKEVFEPFFDNKKYFSTPSGWNCTVKTTIGNTDADKDLPWNVFFNSIVNQHLTPFLETLNPNSPNLDIVAEPWLNIYEKYDFQEYHNHLGPSNHFSCAYLMSVPKNSGEIIFTRDNCGFYEQTGLSRKFNIPFDVEKFKPINQRQGMLLIFPSYLGHYVSSNMSDERRISLSANFYIGLQEERNAIKTETKNWRI